MSPSADNKLDATGIGLGFLDVEYRTVEARATSTFVRLTSITEAPADVLGLPLVMAQDNAAVERDRAKKIIGEQIVSRLRMEPPAAQR